MSVVETVAERQGRLWGARAAAWAEQEEAEGARFEVALERLAPGPGDALLDLGCGSGVLLRRAADRGARAHGIDASEALVEIARRRVPEADVRVGDLERLPYPDDAFDAVTSLCSIFFADDVEAALREARRVARPRAGVLVQVWGVPERCELLQMLAQLAPLRRSAGPPPAPLGAPGTLEALAAAAGLEPEVAFDVPLTLEYPDERTLLHRTLSPGPMAAAIEAAGQRTVERAVLDAAAPFRTADGGFRFANEYRYVLARA